MRNTGIFNNALSICTFEKSSLKRFSKIKLDELDFYSILILKRISLCSLQKSSSKYLIFEKIIWSRLLYSSPAPHFDHYTPLHNSLGNKCILTYICMGLKKLKVPILSSFCFFTRGLIHCTVSK